jgi:hypothetical protein
VDAVNNCTSCKNQYLPASQLPCSVCRLRSDLPAWEPSIDEVSRRAAELATTAVALVDDNPKTALGIKKPSLSSVPPASLIHLARAMADGRRKYGHMNWREKNVSSTIYYDAMLRHVFAWLDGENVAEDSGVHHLGHVMACCAIILDAQANGNLNDDRPIPGPASKVIKEFTSA